MQSTRHVMQFVIVALFLVAAVLAGCSSDDSNDEASGPSATATSAPTTVSEPNEEGNQTFEIPDTSDAGWRDNRFPLTDDASIEGLRRYDFDYDSNRGHVDGEVYEDLIPVGGDHNAMWQFCGFYDIGLYPERALHAMEHGAIWIAYRGDVDMTDWVAAAEAETHLVISKADFLTVPLVVTAWGAQLDATDPNDPRIQAFIDQFIRQGPEAAPCERGGVGLPPNDKGPALDL